MIKVVLPVAVLLIVGVGVPPAAPQSLGDLARREEARRKAIKAPAKVITNEDLPSVPPPPPSPAEATAPAEPGAAAPPAADSATSDSPAAGPAGTGAATASGAAGGVPEAAAASPVKDEAYWRQRMSAARDAFARAQAFESALQSQINGLSTDFVNRDDPAQRAVIGADRQKALAELERVKGDIDKAQKEIDDTQEEARRANVPAGWVR